MKVEELDAAPAGACADLLRERCISHPCLRWCGRQRLDKDPQRNAVYSPAALDVVGTCTGLMPLLVLLRSA